ncbi:hypothetical protein HBI56_106330 [Parastagonospora nodorum]|uniref:Uncharacterized protein n=1 Tax=Phaeosphaeria nodorum (strain SN15 / ATCC MYA-4574 / FGSC 10173) TaxID=321614 RepID=A0A7U2FD29_PHANO|nr:hypothetical protein HBH56_132560 [Parastagonospora nodorum]QRD02803.1 hypothetical protein JI435_418690 [Parastagonospora nodorum SN15]KAH3927188.1 hypothetical protein HBH54_160670 [Parastagonospora nodorum]KAH3949414.1 hypothetical protein HBH53_087520 [Parastagonospora nodorum]KAH3974794.1 hypothetical protein HBH52_133980 [Parastagonospora nodorum]
MCGVLEALEAERLTSTNRRPSFSPRTLLQLIRYRDSGKACCRQSTPGENSLETPRRTTPASMTWAATITDPAPIAEQHS